MDDVGVRNDYTNRDEYGRQDDYAPRGLGDIIRSLAFDAQDLVRGEISLAKAEMDQKLQRSIMAMVWVMGGMLLGFAGLVILLQAGVDALTLIPIPVWAASLIVGIVVAAIGALTARGGVGMLSLDRLAPKRTARALQADAQMVKENT